MAEDVALTTAIALQADKLIFLGEQDGIIGQDGRLLHELIPNEVDRLLRDCDDHEEISHFFYAVLPVRVAKAYTALISSLMPKTVH